MSLRRVEKVVVLATGGTIAGRASDASDNIGYTAAQVSVDELLRAIPGLPAALGGRVLHAGQVAQVDSKDMGVAVWQSLALQVAQYLAQEDVVGVIVTHGTDTLEETAFFLQAVLPAALLAQKPVVLTCAMRPATSLSPDGPQNVVDAVAVVTADTACGVLVVCAGVIHGAVDVQKGHTYRLDAFNSGDAGALGYVEEGALRMVRDWPAAQAYKAQGAIDVIALTTDWPRVELVTSYAGASGAVVDALLAQSNAPGALVAPLRGLVVAGTGNGTVHKDLEAALLRAQALGVHVVRASRCAGGRVLPAPDGGSIHSFPDSQGLSAVKARIALMLALLT